MAESGIDEACASHTQIAQRAFELYQQRERHGEAGDALGDWYQAEHELRQEGNSQFTSSRFDRWLAELCRLRGAEPFMPDGRNQPTTPVREMLFLKNSSNCEHVA